MGAKQSSAGAASAVKRATARQGVKRAAAEKNIDELASEQFLASIRQASQGITPSEQVDQDAIEQRRRETQQAKQQQQSIKPLPKNRGAGRPGQETLDSAPPPANMDEWWACVERGEPPSGVTPEQVAMLKETYSQIKRRD